MINSVDFEQCIEENNFKNYFDNDLRLVREYEFRKAVFKFGIAENQRSLVWKFLFGFYQYNSTPRERLIKDKEKQVEYFLMRSKWEQINGLLEKQTFRDDREYDSIRVPLLPFDTKIDLNNDYYRIDNTESENTNSNQQEQQINIDYIKIQLILQIGRINILNSKLVDDIRRIDKDVERTGYLNELNHDKSVDDLTKEKLKNSLRNILITFAAFNQNLNENKNLNDNKSKEHQLNSLGYTQGMNELASVFLSIFNKESVAYWCFSNFMLFDTYSNSGITLNTSSIGNTHILKTNIAHYFSDLGIAKKLKHLSDLLKITDFELYSYLENFDMGNLFFCHEWLILQFKRCFKSTFEFHRCFEILASHFLELHTSALKNISIKDLYSFDLFVCLSLLKQMRNDFLDKCKSEEDLYELLKSKKYLNFFADNFTSIINIAEEIFEKYCIKTQSYSSDEDLNKTKYSQNLILQKLKKLREVMLN